MDQSEGELPPNPRGGIGRGGGSSAMDTSPSPQKVTLGPNKLLVPAAQQQNLVKPNLSLRNSSVTIDLNSVFSQILFNNKLLKL
jgi:hypothetical protein